MKRYIFRIWGETATEFAKTRSKARYKLYLRINDAFGTTFREFIKACT